MVSDRFKAFNLILAAPPTISSVCLSSSPTTNKLSTFLTGAEACLMRTWPNHLNLSSLTFAEMGATSSAFLKIPFGILSNIMRPHDQRNILISTASNLLSNDFFIAQKPYNITVVAYQFFFFLITALLRFDKVTDFAGIMAFSTGGFVRTCNHLESSSGTVSINEAVWVWTVSLPVTVVNASDRDPSVQAADIIGLIMWTLGIFVEATADQQKFRFKNSPENRGKWCNVGLWKYSRHPNYFGEIFLWWGIFVVATPVLENVEWLVIFGPIFLTLLLLFLSGIPLLEESADTKYGNVPAYMHYKRTTRSSRLAAPCTLWQSACVVQISIFI
ncbi:hypothetical protein OROHE_007875 [Orobanche hederae]